MGGGLGAEGFGSRVPTKLKRNTSGTFWNTKCIQNSSAARQIQISLQSEKNFLLTSVSSGYPTPRAPSKCIAGNVSIPTQAGARLRNVGVRVLILGENSAEGGNVSKKLKNNQVLVIQNVFTVNVHYFTMFYGFKSVFFFFGEKLEV